MNKNHDDEATSFQTTDSEATTFEKATTVKKKPIVLPRAANQVQPVEAEVKPASKSFWKRTATIAASGLLVGGVATVLMGMKPTEAPDEEQEAIDEEQEAIDEEQEANAVEPEVNAVEPEADAFTHVSGNAPHAPHSHPEWTDGDIQVASSVNDDMSFDDAFSAARAEVGPGGCFEWHGAIYGTYTSDEWSNMSDDARAEWSDHFSWNHIDHSHSDVSQYSTTLPLSETEPDQATDEDPATDPDHTEESEDIPVDDDDIEVVSVDHEVASNALGQDAMDANTDAFSSNPQDIALTGDDDLPEVEILGVVHDDELGANYGGMMIGEQEVILIDVGDDLVFDYMAADINGNGTIEPEELVNIQDEGINVSDLGGINANSDIMASNDDTIDYSTDLYEG